MLSKWLRGFLRNSMIERIRLEAVADARTLAYKDGSLASVIRLDGAMRQYDRQSLWETANRLKVALSPFFLSPGHALLLTFARDTEPGVQAIRRFIETDRERTRQLGLRFDAYLAERDRCLSRHVIDETTLLSIFTRPVAADGFPGTKADATINSRDPECGNGDQLPTSEGTRARHHTLSSAIVEDLCQLGQTVHVLEAVEALQEIRAALYPSLAAHKHDWMPRLESTSDAGADSETGWGSPIPKLPNFFGGYKEDRHGNLLPHGLDWQMAAGDAFILGTEFVRIGDTLFAAFDVTVAPETLTPFNSLIELLGSRENPVAWRCCFLIEPGGLQAIRLKEQYARLFGFTAPVRHGRLRESIEALREIDGAKDTVVRLRMSFAAWANSQDASELRKNIALLRRSAERWGNLSADRVSGDPLATVLSSVPAIAVESTAPAAAAPLSSGIALLPLNRQSSPWQSGPVMLRTRDGRIWPYRAGSSRQNSWLELFIGGSGTGKSVAMNSFCLSAITAKHAGDSESAEMPRVAILDIGGSSEGLVRLVAESLPADRHGEAVHLELRMLPSHAVNVFDTPLGLRQPFAVDRAFLVNFLTILAEPDIAEDSAPLVGLIAASVDQAYAANSDNGTPKRYAEGEASIVDAALQEIGFQASSYTSWWEVVDSLFEQGRVNEAVIAQTFAVPVLTDIVAASHSEQIVSLYTELSEGEIKSQLLKSLHRVISETVRDYPVLAGQTRFNLGSARIVSLDLAHVLSSENDRSGRSVGLMMMLGRHLVTRGWHMDSGEVGNAVDTGALPGMYMEFHLRHAEANRRMPKLLCMDEFHRAASIPAFTAQIMRDIREGRKNNLRVSLASQLLEDFGEGISDAASSVFIFDAPTERAAKGLSGMFGLNRSECQTLRTELTGPGPDGTPLFAIVRHKQGTSMQKLFLTLGPFELWALTTTAEDVALRDCLFKMIGPNAARQALAGRFPAGTAKSEIESRLYHSRQTGLAMPERFESTKVIEALAAEIAITFAQS